MYSKGVPALAMKKTSLLLLFLLTIATAAFAQQQRVRLETPYGPVVIVLYDGTPLHRDNFLKLARTGFYDSLLWHRVIPGFVIQGGDPDSRRAAPGTALGEGERKDAGRIPAEINPAYFHKRGALGMARDNNPDKASSNCQFYIVVGKTFDDAALDKAQGRSGHTIPADQRAVYKTLGGVPHLDGGYTVFGEVVEGMAAVDSIAARPRDRMDRPFDDVRILNARVLRNKKKFLGIF